MKKTPRKSVRRRSPAGQRLREQWRDFIDRIHEALDNEDDLAVEAVIESFRAHVQQAAAAGVEMSVAWHALGMWTWDSDERILCFGRALTCVAKEELQTPPANPLERWTYVHYKALCRFEIARALATEGRLDDARAFLEEALPYARAAEDMPVQGETLEGNLEGRIAGELILLEAQE